MLKAIAAVPLGHVELSECVKLQQLYGHALWFCLGKFYLEGTFEYIPSLVSRHLLPFNFTGGRPYFLTFDP